MLPRKSSRGLALLALSVVLALGAAAKDKPNVSVKANPSITFSPATVFFVAEVKGGADDYQDFYCAAVEWEWGDETRDQSSSDCEPYEAGKSQIKRRFVAQHRYTQANDYRVQFRLKQKDKVVGAGSTNIKVRPGVREPIGF